MVSRFVRIAVMSAAGSIASSAASSSSIRASRKSTSEQERMTPTLIRSPRSTRSPPARSPIEGPCACAPARSVYRRRLPELIRSQIRGSAGEPVVDVGDIHPCIDSLAAGLQFEIEIGCLVRLPIVAGVRWRVGRLKAFEDVVVDFNAVGL